LNRGDTCLQTANQKDSRGSLPAQRLCSPFFDLGQRACISGERDQAQLILKWKPSVCGVRSWFLFVLHWDPERGDARRQTRDLAASIMKIREANIATVRCRRNPKGRAARKLKTNAETQKGTIEIHAGA
jgi:hypothetical protein